MKLEPHKELPDVLVIEPKVFGDARGFFLETYNQERYAQAGLDVRFVQDNMSASKRGILRGMHLQHPGGQGKLVSVVVGKVYDVALDVRQGSPTFGRWAGFELSGDDHRQVYIPPGFAHGFCVLSERAIFTYKCTDFYRPEAELGVIWNDPDVGIDWPMESPELSEKDRVHPRLADIDPQRLPKYEGSPS